MSEAQAIVPFGKYRGQPIEVLRADQQYVDWLMAQDWFRERNPSLYQIIINNFQEPSETPEHNTLQVRFLDEKFRLAFLTALGWRPMVDWKSVVRDYYCSGIKAKIKDFQDDVRLGYASYQTKLEEARLKLVEVEAEFAALTTLPRRKDIFNVEFEISG
jgi:uncharacterized protein (DUF3820 family)